MLSASSGPHAIRDGRPVTSFASSCYLGLDFGPWLAEQAKGTGETAFGLGLPRGLAADDSTLALEAALAVLTGRPRVVLARSTLHAVVDLVPGLAGEGGLVVQDERAYPISRMAVDCAVGRGATRVVVRHGDPAAVRCALAGCPRRPAAVVCDSLTLPGELAPLRDLAAVCAEYGATLVVDDTQAIGLLGRRDPASPSPYGVGGGGALLHLGVRAPHVVQVASLAKALGVPIALLAGDDRLLQRYGHRAELPWAGSPPDPLTVAAARYAVDLNASSGEGLRRQLAATVGEFRRKAGTTGLGSFPVQSWYVPTPRHARRVEMALLRAGVWAVRLDAAPERPGAAAVRFFLSAAHRGPVLDRALHAITTVRGSLRPW